MSFLAAFLKSLGVSAPAKDDAKAIKKRRSQKPSGPNTHFYLLNLKFKFIIGTYLQTRIDYGRIVKDSFFPGDFLQSFVDADGRPIGPMRRHGFHHIGHSENSGFNKDLLSF